MCRLVYHCHCAGAFGHGLACDEVGRVEIAVAAGAVHQQEVAHDGVGQGLGEGTCGMLEEGVAGAFGGGFLIEGAVAFGGTTQGGEDGLLLIAKGHGRSLLVVFLYAFEVGAVGNALDGCHYLQLAGTLVDGEHTAVALEAFAGVFLHESTAAMHLYAVVGVAAGELAGHEFDERREDVGHTGCWFGRG